MKNLLLLTFKFTQYLNIGLLRLVASITSKFLFVLIIYIYWNVYGLLNRKSNQSQKSKSTVNKTYKKWNSLFLLILNFKPSKFLSNSSFWIDGNFFNCFIAWFFSLVLLVDFFNIFTSSDFDNCLPFSDIYTHLYLL